MLKRRAITKLKNKINNFKGTIYYKFYPDKAYYEEISAEEVADLQEANAMNRGDGSGGE